MRTCRLVCRRWASVIGESVTAIGVSGDLMREQVLGDGGGGDGGGGGGGGLLAAAACASSATDGDGSEDEAHEAGIAATLDPSTGGSLRCSALLAAMRRLRRLSRRLAFAFPRAHTAVVAFDVGYGDHAAPPPDETAARLAALLGGMPNLARLRLAVRALGANDEEIDDPQVCE